MFINYLIGVFVFALGLCIGSFLNCVIYRMESEKDLRGRSFCPHCKHTLGWQDLFPVFSFLLLGGKCRYCKAKISWQYPVVELATGIIFLVILKFAPVLAVMPGLIWCLNVAFLFYIASSLILIFVYDLKHYLIPDIVLFPAIIITLIHDFLYSYFTVHDYSYFINSLLAVVIASGFFLAIFLISKGKWMGFGDVKLAVLMGLLLGTWNVLVALFLAFFLGAIIGLTLMVLKGKSLKSEIPFGPFLITGTFIAMLYGNQIIQWYLNCLKI